MTGTKYINVLAVRALNLGSLVTYRNLSNVSIRDMAHSRYVQSLQGGPTKCTQNHPEDSKTLSQTFRTFFRNFIFFVLSPKTVSFFDAIFFLFTKNNLIRRPSCTRRIVSWDENGFGRTLKRKGINITRNRHEKAAWPKLLIWTKTVKKRNLDTRLCTFEKKKPENVFPHRYL